MALVCLGSVGAAPGVTTLSVLTAASWPRPAVLLEADPSGGVLAVRYRLGRSPGLAGLAAIVRQGAPPEAIWAYTQMLPGDLPVVVAPESGPVTTNILDDASHELARWCRHQQGVDIIVDCGRLAMRDVTWPLWAAADDMLLVTRPRADELYPVAHRFKALENHVRSLGLVLVGDRPYRPDEIAAQLELPIRGTVADDPRAASVLATGGSGRTLRRSALVRSVRTLADSLALRLGLPAVSSTSAGLPEAEAERGKRRRRARGSEPLASAPPRRPAGPPRPPADPSISRAPTSDGYGDAVPLGPGSAPGSGGGAPPPPSRPQPRPSDAPPPSPPPPPDADGQAGSAGSADAGGPGPAGSTSPGSPSSPTSPGTTAPPPPPPPPAARRPRQAARPPGATPEPPPPPPPPVWSPSPAPSEDGPGTPGSETDGKAGRGADIGREDDAGRAEDDGPDGSTEARTPGGSATGAQGADDLPADDQAVNGHGSEMRAAGVQAGGGSLDDLSSAIKAADALGSKVEELSELAKASVEVNGTGERGAGDDGQGPDGVPIPSTRHGPGALPLSYLERTAAALADGARQFPPPPARTHRSGDGEPTTTEFESPHGRIIVKLPPLPQRNGQSSPASAGAAGAQDQEPAPAQPDRRTDQTANPGPDEDAHLEPTSAASAAAAGTEASGRHSTARLGPGAASVAPDGRSSDAGPPEGRQEARAGAPGTRSVG